MNTNPIITLFLQGPFSACEKRFEKSLLIHQLKQRLEVITGITSFQMKLKLIELNATLENDDVMLGYYPLQDYMTLQITSTGPVQIDYNNTTQVEKMEMQDEEYDKRTDSVRHFKRMHKLGRFQDQDPLKEDEFEKEATSLQIGDRCILTGDDDKRGTVQFIGKTEFKPGYWVGVEYDEPGYFYINL
jgi:tubulin-folding cofactor B